MRELLVLMVSLTLSACATTKDTGLAKPVQIPELPASLGIKATALPPITDNTMGGLVIDGANSDIRYNEVAHQLNNVIDLYNCVKVSINEKKDIKTCLQ